MMNNKDKLKKTDNSSLPEGWKRVRLGEVIIENKKSPFKVEDADNEGYYPFFTSGESILRHSKFIIDGENLLLSTGGTSYVYHYNGKASHSADTYSFKTKINARFLYYTLQGKVNEITFRFFIGSGLEHLQKDDLKRNFIIAFPEYLPEQQKIAEILETVDDAIEKTDKIIEKYKRIKQGLMQDLLTKGIVGNYESGIMNYELRDEKKHKFKDSPLGRIPEEWEVVRLGEVDKSIDYGHTAAATNEEVGPKFLRITDIQDNKVNWDLVPFCEISKSLIEKYQLRDYDIVFSRTGATTGKSYLIKNPPYSIFASYLIRVRLDSKVINPKFIEFFFYSYYYWKQILSNLSGSAQEGFNASKLKNLFIPHPPLPEQQKIAEVLSQVDEVIEKETAYKEKLQRLKSGLMEDLLTGKVRVDCLIENLEGENV